MKFAGKASKRVAAALGLLLGSFVALAGQTGSDRATNLKAIGLSQFQSNAQFAKIANSDVLYWAPLLAVNQVASRLYVLGNWVQFPSSLSSQVSGIPIGTMIEVHGTIDDSGSAQLTSVVVQADTLFVPGATPLYLKAPISAVDAATGVARIGDLEVDFSGSLHSLSSDSVVVGSVISFVGLQFSSAKKLYAQAALVKATNLGQTGSDRSTLGQTGSDRTAFGQTGSDRSTLGQTGSDRLKLGQTGSDRSTLGQTGSDRLKLGQTGSDRSTLGQTGSDRLKLGQTGSDRSTLGQTGSDRLKLGQTGSDRSTR